MPDLNRVILAGRIGADPIQRFTKNGNPVVQFPLATSRAEETQWHRIVTWGKLSDYCNKYLHKGESVYLEGHIKTRKYEDAEGEERYSFEVHADKVNFLARPKNDHATEMGTETETEAGSDLPISVPA